MHASLTLQLSKAYLREGARAFFRPRFKERLGLPSLKRTNDRAALTRFLREHLIILYVGVCLEFLVAIVLFATLVVGSQVVAKVLSLLLVKFGVKETWASTTEIFAVGMGFVALVFLLCFFVKLVRDFGRLVNVIIDRKLRRPFEDELSPTTTGGWWP